ncbi:MAG: ATP-binding protein [Clostridia bacterium]|nr:ATP-binding protein [Clostridia bacterium]
MIKIISGPRGCGKTSRIIEKANEASEISKGNIVFVTDTGSISRAVKTSIRFVNIKELAGDGVNEKYFLGFIDGLLAGNRDITALYIDGLARILDVQAEYLEEFFIALENIADKNDVQIITTVTCDKPFKYMKKYL